MTDLECGVGQGANALAERISATTDELYVRVAVFVSSPERKRELIAMARKELNDLEQELIKRGEI